MLPKFLVLFGLYVSQFIPTTFFLQAVPVFLRQKQLSLADIGLLGILILPASLKFLWAPFIDRYSLGKSHSYKGWILGFQGAVVLFMLLASTFNIQEQFHQLLGTMFFIFLCTTTQDIGTDALAIKILRKSEQKWGNVLQAGGNFIGAIVGGGASLLFLETLGWPITIRILAILVIVCVTPVSLYQEMSVSQSRASFNMRSYLQSLLTPFRESHGSFWLIIILLYMVGENVSSTLIRPLLVDRGLSLSEIGWLLGIYAYLSRIIGALTAGLIIKKLGTLSTLICFGIVANLLSLVYILPIIHPVNILTMYVVCLGVSGVQGMAYTALLYAMMRRTTRQAAAASYTMQISIAFMGVTLSTLMAGWAAESHGYVFALILGFLLSMLGVLSLVKMKAVDFDEYLINE